MSDSAILRTVTRSRRRTAARLAALALGFVVAGGSSCPFRAQNPADPFGTGETQVTGPRVIVSNSAGASVLTFRRDTNLNGNIAPAMELKGNLTKLPRIDGVALNSAGQLLAAGDDNTILGVGSVVVFKDATKANGNQAPLRRVTGILTNLEGGVFSLTVDQPRDIAYVGTGFAGGSIMVFDDTTQDSFDGNIKPSRQIGSATLDKPVALYVVTGTDELYVASVSPTGVSTILVFANASTKNNTVIANRTITNVGTVEGIFVDEANDTLYVVQTEGNFGFVARYTKASTLNGVVISSTRFQIPTAKLLRSIAVDAAGTGYIVDEGNLLFVYENVASRNGVASPTRTVTGGFTRFLSPRDLTLAD